MQVRDDSTTVRQAPSDLRQWLGRREVVHDQVTASPLARLSATLDRNDHPPSEGDAVPPLWMWLYFLPSERERDLGEDGHARRGGFLPPVTLPRRMWAGGRLKFLREIQVGSTVTRTSEIVGISEKVGRSGPLVFVAVRHEIADAEGLAVVEEHDIVYRGQSGDESPTPARMSPRESSWSREVCPDDVLLFRFSALTFNGHRIHYDRRYATEIEKYPGLVVHGPLIAVLLLDLLRRNLPDARVREFSFRAVRPLFDLEPFWVCGNVDSPQSVSLWAKDQRGRMAMEAVALLPSTGN